MDFFGIGWMEMLVIGLVALIVVGPKQLPQAAQTIGRLIGYASQQWRNIQEQIRQPMENEIIDLKGKIKDTVHDITDVEPIRRPVENGIIDLKGKIEDTIHEITDIEPLSEENIKKDQ